MASGKRLRLRTLDGQGGKIPITIGLQQQGPAAKAVGKDDRNRPRGIADNVPIGHDEAMRSIDGHQCPRAQRRAVLFRGDNSHYGRMGNLCGGRNRCRPNRGNRRTKRDQNRQEIFHATHSLSGKRDNEPLSLLFGDRQAPTYSNPTAGGKCGDAERKAGKLHAAPSGISPVVSWVFGIGRRC